MKLLQKQVTQVRLSEQLHFICEKVLKTVENYTYNFIFYKYLKGVWKSKIQITKCYQLKFEYYFELFYVQCSFEINLKNIVSLCIINVN